MKSSYQLVSLLDMYQIDAAAFYESIVIIRQVVSMAENIPADVQRMAMSPSNAESTRSMLTDQLTKTIEPLHVPVTKLTLRDLLRSLEDPTITYIGCGQLLFNLSETLKRELETAKVFSLDSARANFYEPLEPLFGAEVDSKFPSIINEIKESGKCYACDLTTASAFHSIPLGVWSLE